MTNLKSFRFGFIGLLMIFAILMLTFNKSGHEDITLVNIDALVDGDIEPPKNTINSNKRAFKNIQPVTHQSDFNTDDAQVLVEKISRVRDERTPPTIDSEKNADLFKFKNQFGSTSNTDIKFDA
ncbi:hypothetical protein N9H96_03370, partial [Porticoccaceae bacterium]|nr:hypothetical protein [Porticoccaceae bacterium]